MKRLTAIALALGFCAVAPAQAQTASNDEVIVMIFDQIERTILQEYATTPDAVERSSNSGGKYRGPDKVPPGHMPGPGQCRAWVFGTPPGQQAAAGDCATVAASMPANAELIYGGTARGAVLPSGYGVDLPSDILDKLPRRQDTERVVVGDDIVLIDRSTRIILDVLEGVIRGN